MVMNRASNVASPKASRRTDASQTPAVVCAVLMAHAPILVPAVGGTRGGAARASCRAMRAAATAVLSHQPDSLVVISPHSPCQAGAFGLWDDDRLEGSFDPFGVPEVRVSLPNDRQLADAIAVEAQWRNVGIWAIQHHGLDHGALVPLWFLAEAGWAGPTVIVSLDGSGDGELTGLGEAIVAAANQLHRRIAVIASGDMSHRLTKNAPGGFDPQAHQFDEAFIRRIRRGEYREIQNLDPGLREIAAEDAVASTLVAAAAAGWSSSGHQVLHYEGPFGVGYGVAILFAGDSKALPAESGETTPTRHDGGRLPEVARRSVAAALSGSSEVAPAASGKYLTTPRGIFVTVRQRDGALRGCVGTVLPVGSDLVEETWRNARLAAWQDLRFAPVTAEELADLRFEVSVLHAIETVSAAELDPRRYGVIVSTDDGRRGLLLPGIANLQTVAAQLQLARQKGGIDPDEPVTLQRFEVDHFEEPDRGPNP